MNEKQLLNLIGNDVSPYALISSMLIASARNNSKLTSEEKAERHEKRRLISEENIRVAKIIKNICPNCDGKLSRGKKDKKNEYKRTWACKSCEKSHTM